MRLNDLLEPLIAWVREEAAADPQVVDWAVRGSATTRAQRLYARGAQGLAPHQERQVSETSVMLTLMVRVGASQEQAGVDVPWQGGPEGWAEAYARAHTLARAGRSPIWEPVARPDAWPEVDAGCPRILASVDGAADELERRLLAACAAADEARACSAEVFVGATERLVQARGAPPRRERTTDLYLELAVERPDGPHDQEVHERLSGVTLADADVERFVREVAAAARALGETSPPPTARDLPVVISALDFASLLEAVRGRLQGANRYHRMPVFGVGDAVHAGSLDGDPLTLAVDPSLPGMALSRAATPDGQVACAGDLIVDGVVVANPLENRFAQYLGEPAAPLAGNLVVRPGSRDAAALLAGDVLEVVRFASLIVNRATLTWSGEVQFAWLRATDGSARAVKGGIVAGDLRENLGALRLSAEVGRVNRPEASGEPALGYVGPAWIRLERGVSVTGA